MTPAQSSGRTETLNGVRLYFEVHGTGEPIILLHGFTGTSQDWTPLIAEWQARFQLIAPDLRGHGRSSILSKPFRHQDAAGDIIALLDDLGISACEAIGVSGGGNILLHVATSQPERIRAMVLVSATPYFPMQARALMRQYPQNVGEEQWETLRRQHPGRDVQVRALLASAEAFADSYDDMNFTPPFLGKIRARTLIVQGDRDPFYPVELSVSMAQSIPDSSLWIVPNGGHVPVTGQLWPEFLRTAAAFLGA
jgi:pimeloyl-ACP methyl ester carboxylesterase